MTARLLALPSDDGHACSSQKCYTWFTSSAAIVVFIYEAMTYDVIFLRQILPAVAKESCVLPFMLAFNMSLGLALWSYYAARVSDPGKVPQRWQEFVSNMGELLPIVPPRLEWQAGKATYCHMCGVPRPERAHHCKVCGHCVLRMDHHCPWLSNCVGFKNHKFFLLAVGYAFLTSCIGFFTALPELIACFAELVGMRFGDTLPHGGQLNLQSPYIWAFILFGIVACVLLPLLAAMMFAHFCLGCRNTTTIEGHFQNGNPFCQGSSAANLAQIFGDLGIDWIFPVMPLKPVSDGVSYERTDVEKHRFSDMDTPERIWRSRYEIAEDTEETEVLADSDPPFMVGLMSWWNGGRGGSGGGSGDQDCLIDRGEERRRSASPKEARVVSL